MFEGVGGTGGREGKSVSSALGRIDVGGFTNIYISYRPPSNTRHRSFAHSWQIWVSTKITISQLECTIVFSYSPLYFADFWSWLLIIETLRWGWDMRLCAEVEIPLRFYCWLWYSMFEFEVWSLFQFCIWHTHLFNPFHQLADNLLISLMGQTLQVPG